MPKGVVLKYAQGLAADPNVTPAAYPGEIGGGHTRVALRHSGSNTLSSDSAERIVRRLKRDHPEIAEALARAVINEPDDSRLLKDVMQGASVEVDVADFPRGELQNWLAPTSLYA
jgi:hypothetical protein